MATCNHMDCNERDLPRIREALNDAGLDDQAAEVTHRCPPKGSGIMPCCGRTPFEVSPCDRMTLDPNFVTCGKTRADDA